MIKFYVLFLNLNKFYIEKLKLIIIKKNNLKNLTLKI